MSRRRSDANVQFAPITLAIGQLRELTQIDLDALQSLLERGSDYFVLHEGRDPTATEARDEWDALPSGTPRSHKHVIGLFRPDLVGVAELVRDWPRPGTWNIGLLLLDPAIRRQRAGTDTVSAIDAWAARSGADRLRISVTPANAGALSFWQRRGFTRVPAQPTAVRAHATAIALERPIQGDARQSPVSQDSP
jgi:RimJ/RimL family protein N-acetyltransferase